RQVALGLPTFRDIPNIGVLHAHALWGIYRARAEANLDKKKVPARIMATRWLTDVIDHIQHDLRVARYQKKLKRIRTTWMSKSCNWFSWEPGEQDGTPTIMSLNPYPSSRHPTASPPRPGKSPCGQGP